MFVGRARELEALAHALGSVQAGAGTTVLVAGEPGIGKSRLASELATRARDAGFEVLLGRSIDLVGTELPYQPFVEALRPLGELPRDAGSQLRVFERTLAMLADRTAVAPRAADPRGPALGRHVDARSRRLPRPPPADQRALLLVTYRADEPVSAERLRRVTDAVRRSGSTITLALGPLGHADLRTLLAAHAGAPLPPAQMDAIVARSEGNPFFAEELLAADPDGELPRGLRDALLQRVAGLDRGTQSLLRLAAAAGHDVSYSLLAAVAGRPDRDLRESLRRAVEHGVLVADQAAGSFRFRHALLAEAIYVTILPGEREELHARLAEELARSDAATAAELAPHWMAAGRSSEALAASVEAARQGEAVFGLTEAHAHLERALALWPSVADAPELAGLDLAELCAWTAEVAAAVGAATRAAELTERAIDLVGPDDAHRTALLLVHLAEHLYQTDRDGAGLAALERAVELVPAEPPSPERAYALGSLAGGLMVAWRHAESLPIGEQALVLARRVGAREAEVRALTVLGGDLAYLGRGEEGVAHFRHALQLAEEIGDRIGLERAYVNFTDALTMLGRLRESARVGQAGLETLRAYGIHSTLLVANQIEARLAIGDWDEAETLSAAALRGTTSSFRSWLLIFRADVEIGRGDFDAARARLEAASATLRQDRTIGLYSARLGELALWERRWTDAAAAIQTGLAQARRRETAQIRVQLCAKGLRAQAEIAALARARRKSDGVDRAQELLDTARRAAAEALAITPNVAGWLALAEAEHARARAVARPELWSDAADTWDHLERPPLVAYCRWRQAEALITARATRADATVPLRQAHATAARLRARPLLHEIERFAERARLDPTPPPEASRRPEQLLGLTPREAEVLTLVARGLTNREIAAALVISVKTASVHVSHILHKLDAPNRLEAAAIAHRIAAD